MNDLGGYLKRSAQSSRGPVVGGVLLLVLAAIVLYVFRSPEFEDIKTGLMVGFVSANVWTVIIYAGSVTASSGRARQRTVQRRDAAPKDLGSTSRNPLAIASLAIATICSVGLLVSISQLHRWKDGFLTAALVSAFPLLMAVACAMVGLTHANENRRPHRRLAIASMWISWTLFVFVLVWGVSQFDLWGDSWS